MQLVSFADLPRLFAAARWMSSSAKALLDGLERAGKGIRDMGLSCQTRAKGPKTVPRE